MDGEFQAWSESFHWRFSFWRVETVENCLHFEHRREIRKKIRQKSHKRRGVTSSKFQTSVIWRRRQNSFDETFTERKVNLSSSLRHRVSVTLYREYQSTVSLCVAFDCELRHISYRSRICLFNLNTNIDTSCGDICEKCFQTIRVRPLLHIKQASADDLM